MEVRVITHVEERLTGYSSDNLTLIGVTIQILKDIQFASNLSFNITKVLYYPPFNAAEDFFTQQIPPQLSSRVADLAASHYYFTCQRVKQNLSVLLPLATERFRAFFIQPNVMESRSIYLAPFGLPVAVVQYLTVLLLIIAGVILSWTSIHQGKARIPFKSSAYDAIWGIIAAYALKSCQELKSTIPLKILLITASLFFLVIFSLYSAFLVSLLSSSLAPIREFSDLISHGFSIYETASLSSARTQNRKFKEPSVPIKSNNDSFQRILEGGHAHVNHANSYLYYFSGIGLSPDDLCKKVSLVPFFPGVSSGFYVSRDISRVLKEAMNLRIARMGETGLLHKYNSVYFRGSPISCPRNVREYFEMEMLHVSSLFITLGVTGIISIAILLVEVILFKINWTW